MIENGVELQVAVRQFRILEHALQALRDQLAGENAWLLESTEEAYRQRVDGLTAEIVDYLGRHPEELTRVLPPLEPSSVEDMVSVGD